MTDIRQGWESLIMLCLFIIGITHYVMFVYYLPWLISQSLARHYSYVYHTNTRLIWYGHKHMHKHSQAAATAASRSAAQPRLWPPVPAAQPCLQPPVLATQLRLQ